MSRDSLNMECPYCGTQAGSTTVFKELRTYPDFTALTYLGGRLVADWNSSKYTVIEQYFLLSLLSYFQFVDILSIRLKDLRNLNLKKKV